ncbi:uncharacterized protein RCC_04085 [Ramularia collo-cygni]|uniref:Uncharacterized protein n=1 Tax=Ramularia collo-cygni TaxID=112498 RepID=A0A2D3UYG1_9PEZI|nr:uncharacterized protein RCC_04085 [Ramularia collo-cygni]CZT18240.1 uncharacterized protein RCC_04085 [Ramularia collo-cygni]
MANDTTSTSSSSPRADPEHSISPPLPRAARFTPVNVDDRGEPRRLRHVTRAAMQQHSRDGTIGEDDGPEPGFQGRPHGTDFDQVEHQDDVTESENEEYEEEEHDEDERGEQDVEAGAPVANPPFPRFYNGIRRTTSTSAGPDAQGAVDTGPAVRASGSSAAGTATGETKRGRKPGATKKENARPWGDAECIALLQLYIDNPKATHKAIAEMHHVRFWRADAAWEGRSFSACQQRLIALNDRSRDRARLPGVLAEMKRAFAAAGGTETENFAMAGPEDERDKGATEEQGRVRGVNSGGKAGAGEEGEDITSTPRRTTFTQAENVRIPAPDAEAVNAARLLLSLSGKQI